MPSLLIHPSVDSIHEVCCEFPAGVFDPFEEKVHIYTKGDSVNILENSKTVSGTGFVEGVVLDLEEIF